MKRVFLILSLCLTVTINSFADDLSMGKQCYENARSGWGAAYYRKAIPYLQNAAKQGYGEACYLLGTMYFWGYGIEENYSIAKNMFEKSIQFGYNRGEAELGLMYEYGYGVSKDMAKAISLYEKSAGRGLSIGQYLLAIAYWNLYWNLGDNSKQEIIFRMYKSVKDSRESDPLPFFHWYNWTEYNLGVCYEYGIGVKADYEKALNIYDNTYSNGGGRFIPTEYRAYLLRYANEKSGNREVIWPLRLEDCIESDEDRYGTPVNYYRLYLYYDESNYLIKSASKGYGPALKKLSECYRNGSSGISINLIKAKEMEKKAEEWFAKYGDEYEKEQRIENDPEYRNSIGIYIPGDIWKSPSGYSFKVKNVNSDGTPFDIPTEDEIREFLAAKEKKLAEKNRIAENARLDSDEEYRKSKGVYRFGDLFKDNRGNYYVVLSVDNNGKPTELMMPEHRSISYESYVKDYYGHVLSPSEFEAVNAKFDEINARLSKAGAPRLIRYSYITNYRTGSVIWKQTFNRSNVGEYVESKSLAGRNINLMVKCTYPELKNAGFVD